MRRRFTILVAICGVAAMSASVATAKAASPSRTIHAHFDDPGGGSFAPVCGPTADPICTFQVDGGAFFTGDLEGSTHYHAVGTLNPADHGMDYELYETFTGSVVGCGTGSVSWIVRGALNDESFQTFDPADGTVTMHNTVTIVAGSGTGALAGMTGSFHSEGRLNPATFENHGDFDGSVTCRAAHGPGRR